MITASRQDWSKYETLLRKENEAWFRGMTPQERFAIYEDLFNVIWNGRRDAQDSGRLDQWRWDQKLAQRARMIDAFTKLDQVRRERAAASNAG